MRTYALRSRIVSVVLAIVFVVAHFNMSSVSASATTESDKNILLNDTNHTEVTGFSKEAKSEIALKTELGETVFEIESMREANVKHFHLEDGSFQAVVYAKPVHKLNSDGKWDVIDNTLYPDGNSLKTKDNRLKFAKDIDGDNDIFSIHDGEYDIVFGTTGYFKSSGYVAPKDTMTYEDKLEELKAIERLSSEIRYDSAFANASLSYQIESDNVKESIIISKKDSVSNYAYSYKISLSGLVAYLEDDEIVFYDETTKEAKYKIPRPYMYDGKDNMSFDIEYSLVQNGSGNYVLTITPDSNWINDSERYFPVTIDHSLLDVGQTIDTYVNYSDPTKNYGGEHELWVSNTKQTYYKFTTPNFPSGINITSADVKLPYYYNVVNNESIEVGIYRIISNWSENSVTWNNKPSTATQNLDTRDIYANGALSNNPQYVTFTVTNYIKSWFTGTSNNGFALKREGGSNYSVIFVAREKMQKFAQLTIYYDGTHLAEGVYSIKKQNENTYLKSYIPQNLAWVLQDTVSYTSPPTTHEHFENMFKIAYRPEHNDYVIRSMLDNALVIFPSLYNNAPIAGRRTESDSALSTGFTWNLVYNSGYYNITYTENGTTYYVKSLSTENDAKVVFTTNVNDSGTKWSFYKYNDITEEDIEMDKRASTLLPGESFSFVAHMFSTRIGHNGPLTYSVKNADGTTTDKAAINSSTGVLQALKTGKIKVGVTYSGAPWIWWWELIIADVAQVSCYNNLGFWDVPNGASNQTVECNEENQLKRSTWQFIHQNSDYYLIKNTITGYYLKNSSNQLVHVVHTSSSYPNNMIWKVIHQEDNSYKIQSKSNSSYYITEQNVSHSTQDPDIQLSNESAGQRQSWNIRTGRLYFQISYDNGFIEWNKNSGESTLVTTARIENNIKSDYLIKISDAFADQCGVYIDFYSLSSYLSDADKCPNSGINDDCTCISISSCLLKWNDSPSNNNNVAGFSHNCHHKNMTRLRNNLINSTSRNHILITYTGHRSCFYDTEDGHEYNTLTGLSDYDNPIICMHVRQSDRKSSILVLAHEITHSFGIQHHSAHSRPCIMDNNRYSDNDPDVPSTYWCQECINAIRSRVNNY